MLIHPLLLNESRYCKNGHIIHNDMVIKQMWVELTVNDFCEKRLGKTSFTVNTLEF